MEILEQQAGFFESTLLAGGVDAHKHLSGGQNGRESVHGRVNDYAPGTVQCNKIIQRPSKPSKKATAR
jgi:hypothetical protein